jgi:hypothetical protein
MGLSEKNLTFENVDVCTNFNDPDSLLMAENGSVLADVTGEKDVPRGYRRSNAFAMCFESDEIIARKPFFSVQQLFDVSY